MKTVDHNQLLKALHQVGIQAGDGLLVHSALQFLGHPLGGVETYLKAVCEAIGCFLEGTREEEQFIRDELSETTGTLAVPTFNFGFGRGEPYDPQNTPSHGMGAFPELVRQHPAARRTSHPMQSLAVIGRYSVDLAERDTPSAFDPGSAFERMLELDFKILLLGADVDAISLIHYSEQRHNVPYRYWKDFSGSIRYKSGWEPRTYRMFVRNLDLNPQLTLRGIQMELERQEQWQSIPLNYGKIAACRMQDFVRAVDTALHADPYALFIDRPANRP